jgi:type VI secretion system secreted protein Hcp
MAVDYFLKLDGIDGESQDAKHTNQIELLSWSFGGTQGGIRNTGQGLSQGKVDLQDFGFQMNANKASPAIFAAMCGGDHIKSAILTACKAGKEQQEYLKWTFTEVMVSSYSTSGSSENPVESITLTFNECKQSYAPSKKDGSLAAAIEKTYNRSTNVNS